LEVCQGEGGVCRAGGAAAAGGDGPGAVHDRQKLPVRLVDELLLDCPRRVSQDARARVAILVKDVRHAGGVGRVVDCLHDPVVAERVVDPFDLRAARIERRLAHHLRITGVILRVDEEIRRRGRFVDAVQVGVRFELRVDSDSVDVVTDRLPLPLRDRAASSYVLVCRIAKDRSASVAWRDGSPRCQPPPIPQSPQSPLPEIRWTTTPLHPLQSDTIQSYENPANINSSGCPF
jgi:hypothetical protein